MFRKKKKHPVFATKERSDMFYTTFMSFGSIDVECCACGRVHFVDDESSDYNPGEYEQYKKKEKKNPEKYIPHDDDMFISWANYGDIQFVFNCPCNYARYVENILWSERQGIVAYIKIRADIKKAVSVTDATAAKEANDAISD